MNEQSPIHNTPSEPSDRREARRERRADSGSGWIVGVILIILGGLFLMQNMGTFRNPLNNWWALFILIPAVSAFERAFRLYREADNRMTSQMSGSLLLGVVLTLVTLGFLFNIGWTYFGPILIILVGLSILFNAMLPRKE
jgi:cation transport ATPase